MSYVISIKHCLQLQNQIGMALFKSHINKIQILNIKNILSKTITKPNQINNTATINLKEDIRITKIIKEVVLIKIKITRQDTPTTINIKVVINRVISFKTNHHSKFTSKIIKFLKDKIEAINRKRIKISINRLSHLLPLQLLLTTLKQ
jgi:hypothetical protein